MDFYPRSPCGERHLLQHFSISYCKISIHALLAESDIAQLASLKLFGYFYPRSPCGERLSFIISILLKFGISIHALLAESDIFNACCAQPIHAFLSTLSLRRATTSFNIFLYHTAKFLSTLSLRRATTIHHSQIDKHNDFYPRSPCGERRRYRQTS